MPFTQRTENQRLGQFAPLDERKLGLLDQAIEARKQPMTEERKVPKQRALSTRHLEILDQAIAERKEREVPIERPGLIRKGVSAIAGGILGAGEMYGRAIRGLPFGEEAGVGERGISGAILKTTREIEERLPILKEPENTGAIYQGIRSAVTSLTARAPAIAAGAALGAAIGGPAAPITTFIGALGGYIFGGATLFGLAEYDSFIENAVQSERFKQGKITKDQIERGAIKSGLHEAGWEFASDILTGAVTLGMGAPIAKAGVTTLKEWAKTLFKTSGKEMAKRVIAISVGEVTTEMATAGFQTEEMYKLGLTDARFVDGMKQAFGPAFVASLIFAGFFEGGVRLNRRRVKNALENPEVTSEERMGVVNYVSSEMAKISPDLADTWNRLATQSVENKESISMDEKIIDESAKLYTNKVFAPERQELLQREWAKQQEAFRRTPEGRQELIEAEMPEAPEAPMTTISEETTAIAGMEPERAARRIEAFGRIPERGEIIGEERVEPELVTPEGLPLELARREEQIQIALAKEPFERTAEDKLLLQELERIEGVIEPPPPSPMRAFGMRRVEPTPIEPTAEVAREPVGVEKEPVKFMGMQKIGDETFPLFEATTGELKGGQVDYDVARHEIVNVAEYEKAIKAEEVEKPEIKELEKIPEITKPELEEKYGRFLEKVGKRLESEAIGQDILDTLEEKKIRPASVSKAFWEDTFFKLPSEAQSNITKYLTSLTGMKPGDVIATIKGKPIKSKGWIDIAKMVEGDLTAIEHLEGTERGYIALMAYANEQVEVAKPIKPVKPLLPKPPEAKPPEAVTEEIKAKVIPEVKPKVEKVPLEKKEYFITTPEGKQKIEGKPIKIKGFEKYDLFYSKREDQFNISEMTTGLSLATDKTLKGAKQKAFDLLTERKGEIDKVLKEKPKVEDIEEIPTIKETKDRLIKNIKDEKGESALITDLSTLGADAIRRGHTSFKAFSAQMKTTLSEVWDKVKHLMQKAYDAVKVVIRSERGEIVLREPKIKKLTAAEKMLGLRKIVKKITPKALDLGVEFKTDAAQKVSSMYDKTDTELEILRKPSLKNIYQKVKRATVDVSGNIKKELLNKGGQIGKEAVIHHDLIRGASSKAEKITTGATDKIYKNLSKNEERLLNRIIQSRRTIAIEKYTKIRHPGGLGVKEHQDFLDSIPKDIFAKLNKQADLYFTEMREQLKSLKEAGMLSQQDYKTLLSKGDYSPRWFIQHIDPERTYTFRGKKISVPDSGIKSLDTGSEQMLENNSRLMLISTITRIQSRIFRNRANQALHKLAEQVPDNGLVSLAKIVKKTKEGKPIYQKAPGGYEKVSVMIDGKHREMLLPNEMVREWVESDPAMNAQMANIIGWVSGSKILKPMATGLNPEFALANLPRDIAHIWLTTEQYSPALPKALLQMGKDLKATFPDAAKRKGAWLDYVDEGGGMNFLTHQGRITKPGGKLDIIQKVLGYIGETSEIWTRLALRNRALREGKTSAEATWIARSYLDFSQGGWLAKGADTAIPYLNAGIQGTRGIIRAATANPKVFMQKTAQIGGLSIALFLANKFINPDALDEIPEREKVNNFIITTPLSYRDKNGDMRYLYFKIAKDQGQRIVATIFETLTAKYMGEDIDSVQIAQAIQDFIPLMPDQATPPTWDAMMGYLANVDFWRREDIWKGPRVTPKEEFTTYTHPSFVEFGKATGLSPEKTRYALQQYFTYGNIYTSAVGAGFKLMTNQLDKDSKEKVTQEILKDMPFARRVLKATQPYTKYEKRIEEVKIEESTRRYKQNREIDKLSEQFHKKIITKDKINEFVKKQPKEDQTRLKSRFKRYGQIYNIPDRRWWLNISGMPPETRAVMFWNRYRDANKEEKERLSKYLKKVPGVTSKRFYAKLRRLQKELVVGQPAITIPGMVPWKTKKRPAWQKSMFGKKPAWQKGIEF